MKKMTRFIAAAAIILSGLLLVSCGATETIKEIIDSTHKTWYKYSGSTNIEIPLGADDNSDSSESSENLQNAEIYVYYDHGLTVAVQSVSEHDVELYGGLFSTTQEVVVGGTKTYTEEEFGTGKWTALLAAANFKKQNGAPKIVSDPEHCIVVSGDGAQNLKIQWKKFLKQKLVDKLLGDE